MINARTDFTFKHNQNKGRYGWLRLTPAYSLKLVNEILNENNNAKSVLDPFSGTGTTGLVCAERDIDCTLVEINPFLCWLSKIKSQNYKEIELKDAIEIGTNIVNNKFNRNSAYWKPPIKFIERWWDKDVLDTLAFLFHVINSQQKSISTKTHDVLLIAFCRTIIEFSNASFNHQSVSFNKSVKHKYFNNNQIEIEFLNNINKVIIGAIKNIPEKITVVEGDSRRLDSLLNNKYDLVITSPPYANRFSYIRELRPYMYWLGYLKESKEAGDLEWKAIGGTWGSATSNLMTWRNNTTLNIDGFNEIINKISLKSKLLANYVLRYFVDMDAHFSSLVSVLSKRASIYYIVGNSTFYETVVPVQDILSDMLKNYGFKDINVTQIRKRSSKKLLFEYKISAKFK